MGGVFFTEAGGGLHEYVRQLGLTLQRVTARFVREGGVELELFLNSGLFNVHFASPPGEHRVEY